MLQQEGRRNERSRSPKQKVTHLLLVLTSSVVSVFERQNDGEQEVRRSTDDMTHQPEAGHSSSCCLRDQRDDRDLRCVRLLTGYLFEGLRCRCLLSPLTVS